MRGVSDCLDGGRIERRKRRSWGWWRKCIVGDDLGSVLLRRGDSSQRFRHPLLLTPKPLFPRASSVHLTCLLFLFTPFFSFHRDFGAKEIFYEL